MAVFGSCVPHVWLGPCNLPLRLLVAYPIVPCCGVCSWFLLPGSLPVCCLFILVFKVVAVKLVGHIPRISAANWLSTAKIVSWHG